MRDVGARETWKAGGMFVEVIQAVVPPTARAIWRPVVTGADSIPLTGGVLLASNHVSFMDSVVIPVVAPRKVVFLAKSEYFRGQGFKGRLQKAWFESTGMVPVDRDDTKSAIDSLDIALEVLRRGVILLNIAQFSV